MASSASLPALAGGIGGGSGFGGLLGSHAIGPELIPGLPLPISGQPAAGPAQGSQGMADLWLYGMQLFGVRSKGTTTKKYWKARRRTSERALPADARAVGAAPARNVV